MGKRRLIVVRGPQNAEQSTVLPPKILAINALRRQHIDFPHEWWKCLPFLKVLTFQFLFIKPTTVPAQLYSFSAPLFSHDEVTLLEGLSLRWSVRPFVTLSLFVLLEATYGRVSGLILTIYMMLSCSLCSLCSRLVMIPFYILSFLSFFDSFYIFFFFSFSIFLLFISSFSPLFLLD